MSLVISHLKASVENKEILKGIDLKIDPGELHVLMGPNGSGKSTLANVLAGSPQLIVHSGTIKFGTKDIKKLSPDKRAKLGIFLAFQHPVEIPGVSVFNVLRRAQTVRGPVASFPPASAKASAGKPASEVNLSATRPSKRMRSGVGNPSTGATPRNSRFTNGEGKFDAKAFREELVNYLSSLRLSEDFLRRSLNEGFSGGEKKRSEILQMMALKPKLVILDEIDSGLDVDGLRIVAGAIKQFTIQNPQSSVLLITHYARILKYLKPDFVHIMVDGKIIKSGKANMAQKVEERGYKEFEKEVSYA